MTSRRVRKEEQSVENFNRLAAMAQAGDADAFAELARLLRPPIVARLQVLSESYSQVDMEDLEAAAFVGLAEAVHRFEPGDGANFGAFAWHRIRAELSRWLASNTGVLPMPYESWRLARKIDEHYERTGRRPEEEHPDDLQDETGINLAPEIMRARQNGIAWTELEHGDLRPEDDLDTATVVFVEHLREVPDGDRKREALEFCALWDLDYEVAERLVAAAKRRRR